MQVVVEFITWLQIITSAKRRQLLDLGLVLEAFVLERFPVHTNIYICVNAVN